MARRLYRSMEIIGYILTPEFSSRHDRYSTAPAHRESARKPLMALLKSAVWICNSILLALALGRLN